MATIECYRFLAGCYIAFILGTCLWNFEHYRGYIVLYCHVFFSWCGPARTEWNKHKNIVNDVQIPCPHCGKSFKHWGFNKHETTCRLTKDSQKEIREYNCHFESQMCNSKCSHRYLQYWSNWINSSITYRQCTWATPQDEHWWQWWFPCGSIKDHGHCRRVLS